jgi:autotransporter-associated beta strand protein
LFDPDGVENKGSDGGAVRVVGDAAAHLPVGGVFDFPDFGRGSRGVRLAGEAGNNRNFRFGNVNNAVAIAIAAGAGKVTLNGQDANNLMFMLFGNNTNQGSAQTFTINNAGTLEFGEFARLQRGVAAQNHTLSIIGGGQTTILGEVSTSGTGGGFQVSGESVLTLGGTWTSSSQLNIHQGRVDFTSTAALAGDESSWSRIRLGNAGAANQGTLRYIGTADAQVDRQIEIGRGNTAASTGAGAIENNSATGKLVFGNAAFNEANTTAIAARTLTLGGSSTLANEITGAIIDNNTDDGATISVTKEGDGRWILSGNNTYTGNTTVSAGTLLINGSTAAASAVSVASGAVIGGNGTIGGNLSLANGALFGFDTTNTAFTLTLTGTLTLDNSFGVGSLRNLDGTAIAWDTIALNTTYTLLDTSFAFDANNIGNFGFDNRATGLAGGREAYFQNGSLQLVVIPEPSTWALLAGSLTVLVLLRRRRGTC